MCQRSMSSTIYTTIQIVSMNKERILADAAAAYVNSPHVSELRARLQMSPFNRKQERKRIRQDATEHLRHSVGFYQAGMLDQILLIWTIAKWVRWILKQIYN